jgi:hypothetical protein
MSQAAYSSTTDGINDMAILQFPPSSRQVIRPHHNLKCGIVGLFWWMPVEHRRERVDAMLKAGFPRQLVAALTESNVITVRR